MALKTNNKYEVLKESKKSYKLPFLDTEIDNNVGSFCTSLSSGFISPLSSNTPSLTNLFETRGQDDKCSFDQKLQSIFDSFNLDENTPSDLSSTKANTSIKSGWEKSVDSLFDQNSKQFQIFENFVQSSWCGFSDCSMFSYSPLSSLDSQITSDPSYNDLYCNDLNYRMQQECIRQDFEMNGKCVDDALPPNEIFQPLAMSTPFVGRKSDQFKLNNSSIAYKDKENIFPAQQFIPKDNQLNDKQINFFDAVPIESFYLPLSSASYENNKVNKHQGRKRNHPSGYQPYLLPDQLQTINNNNPSQQFGNAKNKKMAKKSSNGKKKVDDFCVFCKNNGAEEILYKSHSVRDSKGRVLCPKLRAYQCPICGADGDSSHTVKYCPKKPIVTMDDLKKLEASSQKSKHSSKRF